MNPICRTQGLLFRTLPLVLALFFSGCAIIGKSPEPVTETVDPSPPPQPVVQEAPPVPFQPEVLTQRVAVLLSDRKPAYENVAVELGALLEDYSVYDLNDESLTPRAVFSNIADFDADLVIAIGLRAATVANAFSRVPVVYCQAFNVADINLDTRKLKGVAALPPLAMQLEAWQALNPNLRRIGAIVGSGHEDLLAEAGEAAESAGLTLHHREARSDRETLYLFNRLTPNIDGFWLFPDNRILSPSVLREMISYASRHRVQVAVFNPALLDFGAHLSTTSLESDIAETVVMVAHRVLRGEGDSIPAVTPLNAINVQTSGALKTPEVAAVNGDAVP